MFAMSSDCTVQHLSDRDTSEFNALQCKAAAKVNSYTLIPQVLDLFPHHRNLLIESVDVLAAAVAQRTHVTLIKAAHSPGRVDF